MHEMAGDCGFYVINVTACGLCTYSLFWLSGLAGILFAVLVVSVLLFSEKY